MEWLTDTEWGPLVTALSAALFGAGFGFLFWLEQQRRRDRAAHAAVRDQAYIDLARVSLDFSLLAQYLGALLGLRSGLQEGIAVTFGGRAPLDSMALFSQMMNETKPVTAAVSAVQAHGSQEGIDLSYQILEAVVDLMDAATTPDAGRRPISRMVFGERRSKAQQEGFDAALDRLSRHRLELLALARSESGRTAVLLRANE